MSKATVWILAGIALFLIGAIVLLTVLSVSDWDFTRFGTQQYETSTHPIGEDFENILIQTITADIQFLPAADGTCRVVCFESEYRKHNVTVTDGTLTVTQTQDERKWYHRIGINVQTPKVTVYLPGETYETLTVRNTTGDTELPRNFRFGTVDISGTTGDIECEASVSGLLKIKISTGDIDIEHVCAGELDVSVATGDLDLSGVDCLGDLRIGFSTGDAEISDISCKNLTAKGNTGDFILENTVASGKITVNGNTGDVRLQSCDAAELFIKTNTGDIKGSLRSDKIFVTKTGTGSVRVPSSSVGGTCELTTNTGDIRITVGTP